MSQITVNPVAEVGGPNAGKFKVHTPTADTYHVTQWDAIQAAVNAASMNGGDTITLLAGIFTLDKVYADYNVKSRYWECTVKAAAQEFWFYPDLDKNFTSHKPILVDRPVTIKGQKNGEAYLTAIQGSKLEDMTGFVAHNEARVQFEDLAFYHIQNPITFYAPGNVKNCFFNACVNAVAAHIDDRLAFPQYDYEDYDTVNETVIEGCTTHESGGQSYSVGSGGRILNCKVVGRPALDVFPWYDWSINLVNFFDGGSRYDAYVDNGQVIYGKLWEPVDPAKLPQQKLLLNVRVRNNEIDFTGYEPHWIGINMVVGNLGDTKAGNVQISQNMMKNLTLFNTALRVVNNPYYLVNQGVFTGMLPYIVPCVLTNVHIFDNQIVRDDEEIYGIGIVGRVLTSSLGFTKKVTFQRNTVVNVWEPAIDAWGIITSNSKSPYNENYGVTNQVAFNYNDFSEAGFPSDYPGFTWGFGEPVPPTEGIAHQPPQLWSVPTDPMASYIWDFDDNKILGGVGKGPKPKLVSKPSKADDYVPAGTVKQPAGKAWGKLRKV